MNKRQFVQQRRTDWKRFETMVNRLERITSSRKMPAREVFEFSRLFRKLSGDLAIVRSREWGNDLAIYLNHLVTRGHNSFYRAPPGTTRKFYDFLAVTFPRLFRANIAYFVVAAILFFVPGGISWVVIQNDPSLAGRIIPNEFLEQFDSMYDSESSQDSDEEIAHTGFEEERTMMAGFYVRNNVGIALACFARGVLLGVGTVYTLLFNGILIGAIAGYVVSQGNAERFLSFVVSHGSFELTAIAVAGGAGLILGNALLHPGQRTRWDAIAVRGRDAVQIAAGAAVMLMIAAVIEAFWSPSGIPAIVKYVVGGLLWLLVVLYLALAGRQR